jgi:hypothetical protein
MSKKAEKSSFRVSDMVIARIAQLLQEAILTQTDVTDHLRMVRLEPDPTDSHVLVLTEDYKKQVIENHKKMEEEARTFALLKKQTPGMSS